MSGLLHEWVTRAAAEAPDSRAVVEDEGALTYGEIDAYSNRLARILWEYGCRPGDRVCLFAPTSALAIASLIGILKAGCTYVPLDPSGPPARNADIIRQCTPTLLLGGGCPPRAVTEVLERTHPAPPLAGWVGPGPAPDGAAFDMADVQGRSTDPHPVDVRPDDLAYIMFTSGTTGSPKGVPITHGSVHAFIEWAVEYFELGPGDRMSAHTALTFDLSVFDIFAAFAAGAELHPVPRRVRLMPHEVANFIGERGLTIWFSVPSQLTYVARFNGLEGRSLTSLRHVIWCGDVIHTPSLLHWKERLPGVLFTNLYGPTETTVASSYYRVPDDFDDPHVAVPIGVACPGEELLLLSATLEAVPEGEIGDLYIGGVGLSPGYWKDAERTKIAFVALPGSDSAHPVYRTGDRARIGADGVMHFHGRSDFLIKMSGYRVDPAEVEYALLGLPEVAACVVVSVGTDQFNGTAIGCVCVSSDGTSVVPLDLKKKLVDTLPNYMVPTRWLTLDDLPVDSRGKIDRARARALLEGEARKPRAPHYTPAHEKA